MRPPLYFFVTGLPKSQPRIKARACGKFAQVYTPKTADDWKLIVRSEAFKALQASAEPTPWEGPLKVVMDFQFLRPKSHYDSKGFLKVNAPTCHTTKPDIDNLFKGTADALTNMGMWGDDKQICIMQISKSYAEGPGFTGCHIQISVASQTGFALH